MGDGKSIYNIGSNTTSIPWRLVLIDSTISSNKNTHWTQPSEQLSDWGVREWEYPMNSGMRWLWVGAGILAAKVIDQASDLFANLFSSKHEAEPVENLWFEKIKN